MKNNTDLRQFIEEKPLTSLGGAVLVGFAFGSGAAMPLLLGAGLSRAGLGGMVKNWLRQEAEQGLRNWLQRQQSQPAVEAQAEPTVEDHSQSDSGAPGQTPLARKVSEELAGYAGTEGRVSQSVQAPIPTD